MNSQLASMIVHAVLSVAILAFCALLYLTRDPVSQNTAFTFAALVIGYWFGSYKPPVPNPQAVVTVPTASISEETK